MPDNYTNAFLKSLRATKGASPSEIKESIDKLINMFTTYIGSVEEKINNLNDEVESLKRTINVLDSTVKVIGNSVSIIKEKSEFLENKIAELEVKIDEAPSKEYNVLQKEKKPMDPVSARAALQSELKSLFKKKRQ